MQVFESVDEKKKKKKKKKKGFDVCTKKKKKTEEEDGRDPLEVLGFDVMMMVMGKLDARSLAQSLLVSPRWLPLASSDSLWTSLCEELWTGKAHLPRIALQQGLPKLSAYSVSVQDSKRTAITMEDLCSHAWEFRFKNPVPPYWLNLDPAWKGTGPPMRRYFHSDGSQTAGPDDKVWGGHECTYSIIKVASSTEQGIVKKHNVRINGWPKMSVSRKSDWSWKLENNVYFYSSVPDAEKEGGTGPHLPT